MALLTRNTSYDRSKLMKRASGARAKGRHKKAIALYREVLEREPDNADVHKKLAPLLAKTGQCAEALASFQVAAEGLVRQGFNEQAIGLLRGAAGQLPTEVILWQSVAELELVRGRGADAFEALVEGRRHMRGRARRREAIQLLIKARQIEPDDFGVTHDLACLLDKAGRGAMAMRLLDELACRPDKRHLIRIRARQLWLKPGIGTLRDSLRALFLRRP